MKRRDFRLAGAALGAATLLPSGPALAGRGRVRMGMIGTGARGQVLLRELLRRLRKHNPNAYIMTENCGDIYGSYTWGNLTWNGAEYDEYYNDFHRHFERKNKEDTH